MFRAVKSGTKFKLAHLNGNKPCVVALLPTGPKPGYHEIIEFVCCPLDDTLHLDSEDLMFYALIKPDFPERYNPEDFKKLREKYYKPMTEKFRCSKKHVQKAVLGGTMVDDAVDLFVRWFENLNLGKHKQVMPIAHNWAMDTQFLIEWLGLETYRYIFHPHYRDTVCASLMMNDRHDARNGHMKFPYQKIDLQYLVSETNPMQTPNGDDTLAMVRDIAMVYRHLINRNML